MPSRLGFTALLTTSLLLTPATAAQAAPAKGASAAAAQAAPAEGLSLDVNDVTAAIGPAGARSFVTLVNTGDEPITLPSVQLTADAGDLRGKAVLDGGSDDCTGDGSTLECTYPGTTVDAHSYTPLALLTVRSTAAAQPGDSGTIRYTVGDATATARVLLAEEVGLAAEPELTTSGAPGGTATFAPGVTNNGPNPARGVVLAAGSGSVSLTYERKFSNCLYADHEFFCDFTEVLEPGKQYVPAEGIPLEIRPDAPAPTRYRSVTQWLTTTDAVRLREEFLQRNPETSTGTGAPLHLVEKPAARAQTDPEELDNYTSVYVDITGENNPDEAATGVTVTGRAGETVDLPVGFTNHGPARLDYARDFPSTIEVRLPSGVTVVSYDSQSCWPTQLFTTFLCYQADDVEVGRTVTFPFTVRLTTPGTTTGSVTVVTSFADGSPSPDQDRTNNTAPIVATVTAA
ncbi:hypothetical protein [Actinoplanes sp. RD1]|uniref:hypothetical protein n=1 Tax=Actinoplanes sp. RD1 TaxID=3064538 RepID=UPI002741F8AA|nr:hypothetical protein [Actinoplanes sp. RD1]